MDADPRVGAAVTDVYLTPAASAVVSPDGWRKLPSGRWVTTLPLLDARTLGVASDSGVLFAHLDYELLLLVCQRLTAWPISPEGVVELNAHGYRLEPVTISPDSSTRAACVSHDQRVWQQLADGWDGRLPVANAGKPWVSGALPGRSRLFGWSKSVRSHSMAPDAFGEWLQPLQNAHNRQHVDYSSLCTLERDTAPDGVTDTEPPPVTEPVPMKFIQARNYTPGRKARIDLVVVHSMEAVEASSTAENVAAWFAGPNAPKASAHFCVDADSTVQCVRDEDTAWHAPGANANGIGVEHAGYARQSAAEWDDPYSRAMLARSAELVAGLCERHDIPIVFVDAAGLLRNERGITTHAEVTKAFRLSTHTDPGAHFPMAAYLAAVTAAKG